jgi:adenine-specific DNA-methyltransferase
MPFLDWVNKNQAQQAAREVPYHLLKQESVHGEPAENLLIQGDNLLALKALIPFYAGRVKCIFIDPPYNTQSAFAHYDDKLEHSQWLSMMYPRLVLLRDLLVEEGSIWVTIDDNEAHYLKALMDEVFGRKNFVANAIWQKKYSPQNDAKWLSDNHDHILIYSRNKDTWRPNLLPRSEAMDARYKNPDDDSRGDWKPADFSVKTYLVANDYPITTPSGRVVNPPNSRCWGTSEIKFKELVADNRIWFGETGNNVPSLKKFLSEVKDGSTAMTIWTYDEVGHNQDAKKEVKEFNQIAVFDTPKPEKLMCKILTLATKPTDIVLDSFLGSGTTAAVAQKMNRRYIGIEMGDHAVTHCIPRLQKVIEGEQGGISAAVNWQGGGGFRFCTLGEAAFDEHGRINAAVKFATLAAFVWHFETGIPSVSLAEKSPHPNPPPQAGEGTNEKVPVRSSPLLGIHNGTAYYLLYNGILGDRKPSSGNVLTHAVLQAINAIFPHAGHKIIYGETTRLGAARLAAENITFKQIPYDVKMRG